MDKSVRSRHRRKYRRVSDDSFGDVTSKKARHTSTCTAQIPHLTDVEQPEEELEPEKPLEYAEYAGKPQVEIVRIKAFAVYYHCRTFGG